MSKIFLTATKTKTCFFIENIGKLIIELIIINNFLVASSSSEDLLKMNTVFPVISAGCLFDVEALK